MADQEAAAESRGCAAGIDAARDAFYRGDIAAKIADLHRDNGGLVTRDDLAEYRTEIEPALRSRFAGIDIYGCGPWWPKSAVRIGCPGPPRHRCFEQRRTGNGRGFPGRQRQSRRCAAGAG